MSTWASHSVGAYAAGEIGLAVYPKRYRPDGTKVGVLYCHGRGGGAPEIRDPAVGPGMYRFMDAIVDAGYPVFSARLAGPSTWGSAASVAQLSQARTYLQGAMGAKAGKVLLMCQSMGHITACAWAAQNPGAVAGIFASIPVCDLTDLYTNNRGGYAAEIDTALGATYSEAANGATINPATLASSGALNGIPWKAYYGTADTTVLPSTVTAFAASVGGTATPITGATHDWTITQSYDPAVALSFFAAATS